MIKVLVCEDEERQLNALTDIINKHPKAHVECTATTITELEEVIMEYEPQLAFLDVNLYEKPVYLALDKIKANASYLMPKLVFVTGFKDEFAAELIMYESLMLIEKPYNQKRIWEAIDKFLIYYPNYESQVVFINYAGGTHIIKYDEITYCKGDGAYSEIWKTDGSKILVSRNLKEIAKLLPTSKFYRIQNSYIVNLSLVEGIVEGACKLKGIQEHFPITNKAGFMERLKSV